MEWLRELEPTNQLPDDGLLAEAADLIEQREREIERLQADGTHSCHDECPRIACVLRREIAGLRKDAARYLWLRRHYHPGTDILDAMRFGTLDEAIDAAMREGKP